jgi:tungstate transport system substrate-binding protein
LKSSTPRNFGTGLKDWEATTSKIQGRSFIQKISSGRAIMKRVIKKRWIGAGLVFSFCFLLSCSGLGKPQTSKFILLSSTIGPIDAGIVGLLENEFEKDTGIRVRHVGSGTGAALDIARKGNVDLVLVHAKSLEEKFVNEGFGTERIDLMYNDFVIVGPSDDPAGIKGIKLATEALRKISEKKATFISRGDKSGTHVAEMELWGKAGIKPSGSWYVVYEKGATGNVPTLRYTDEKSAYTVIDRATYLTLKTQIKLAVLVEKDEALLNYMSLITVNPQKFSKVNYGDVMVFVKWLTSPKKGQRIIRDFGKDKYGTSLFFPNSKEWRMAQGTKN